MMTTKDRLALMDEISRKNDAAWSRYAVQARPGWTWKPVPRQKAHTLHTLCDVCILVFCIPAMLALLIVMA